MAEIEQQVTDVGIQAQAEAEPVSQSEQPAQAASEPTPQAESKPAEKMIPQSQVSKIAAREAREAADRAAREARNAYEAKIAELQRNQQQQQLGASVGGMQAQSPDEIKRLIREQAQQMAQENWAKQIEDNWTSAVKAEMQTDPDFVDAYESLKIEDQPMLVVALSGIDNKMSVLKDLAANPGKYANILMLSHSGAAKLAVSELQKISQSIKANEAALKAPKVEPPLSQITPSNIGGDNGAMSVSDYRNQSWLRG